MKEKCTCNPVDDYFCPDCGEQMIPSYGKNYCVDCGKHEFLFCYECPNKKTQSFWDFLIPKTQHTGLRVINEG